MLTSYLKSLRCAGLPFPRSSASPELRTVAKRHVRFRAEQLEERRVLSGVSPVFVVEMPTAPIATAPTATALISGPVATIDSPVTGQGLSFVKNVSGGIGSSPVATAWSDAILSARDRFFGDASAVDGVMPAKLLGDPTETQPVLPTARSHNPTAVNPVAIVGDPTESGPVMPTSRTSGPGEVGPVSRMAWGDGPVETQPVLPTAILGNPNDADPVLPTAKFTDPTEVQPVLPTSISAGPTDAHPVSATAIYANPVATGQVLGIAARST